MSQDDNAKIKQLSAHVANKIAAGEVVERPASVVKELLENSVDAGATKIEVEITAGGRKLISIVDNGCGMSRRDALMAPERQATSKISEVDDIEHITTLGFRGEALPSIASVSRFTLMTRRVQDNAGTRLDIQGGRLLEVSDCGIPVGTSIEVRDLFFNVPARRSFLKSFQTEQAHIRNIVLVHAIAYPKIMFTLKCDGEEIYRLPPAENLYNRLYELVGEDEMARLIPFDGTYKNIHIYGYAGIPNWTRSDRGGQFIFINGRPASTSAIHAAIREAYPRLDESRKPIFYLFIELPPEDVDVNVHPMKREVRFRRSNDVRDAVISVMSEALQGNSFGITSSSFLEKSSVTSGYAETTASYSDTLVSEIAEEVDSEAPVEKATNSISASIPPSAPPQATAPAPISVDLPFVDTVVAPFSKLQRHDWTPVNTLESDLPQQTFQTTPNSPITEFRILGRLESGYVMLETPGGFTIFDPSSAHERVIYEDLLKQTEGQQSSQLLLIPQTVDMKPIDARRIEALLPYFKDMGFGIEKFGASSFIVDALPEQISDMDCGMVLLDTINYLESAGLNKRRERWREEMIASVACKIAVKNKQVLSDQELVGVIKRLAVCDMPYTSPTGKLTMIFTSLREIDRKFGRTR
jgi:DNA mismatch repair protein MutL